MQQYQQNNDTYYNILFSARSPAAVLTRLDALLETLPSPARLRLAALVPKLLFRFSPLPLDAVQSYLSLTGKILELLSPEDAFGLCLHTFTSFPSLPGSQPYTARMFSFLVAYADQLPVYPFFVGALPKAAARQLQQALLFDLTGGVAPAASTKSLRAGAECLGKFISGGTRLHEFVGEDANAGRRPAECLAHLAMLCETSRFIPEDGGEDREFVCCQVREYATGVLPYIEKAYRLDTKGQLFLWTDFVVSSIASSTLGKELTPLLVREYLGRFPGRPIPGNAVPILFSPQSVAAANSSISSNGSIAKPRDPFSPPPRPICSSSSASVPVLAPQRPSLAADLVQKPTEPRPAALEPVEDDDEDLKRLFIQLQGNPGAAPEPDIVEVPLDSAEAEAESNDSSFDASLLDREVRPPDLVSVASSIHDEAAAVGKEPDGNNNVNVNGNNKAKWMSSHGASSRLMTAVGSKSTKAEGTAVNADDPSTFAIECSAGMVKPLALVDREFVANQLTRFVLKFVDAQDLELRPVAEVFHKHFKHQFRSRRFDPAL